MSLYAPCQLCPRSCGVDRLAGEVGFCGETAALRVSAALLHCGEEPPLVGDKGSGTIFISGCGLGCIFCQNYQISQGTDAAGGGKSLGKEVSTEEFAKICAALRDNGAANINIVTGSHAVPAIVEGLTVAKKAGVELPVLWNSSGYESLQALELLREHVDIYLPDLKTLDSEIAAKFFNAPDYPQAAAAAILKMIEMAGGEREKVIIRHLILPGYPENTRSVLRWFAENANGRNGNGQNRALLSLMTQYTPIPGRTHPLPRTETAPDSFLSEEEYNTVMRYLEEFEIEDGFCQELVTGSDWLPDFQRYNPFSSNLSRPIWHYSTSQM